MSRHRLILAGCGHWWTEHQPEVCHETTPRVCTRDDHRTDLSTTGIVGRSPQGLPMVHVVYAEVPDALDLASPEHWPEDSVRFPRNNFPSKWGWIKILRPFPNG